VNFTLTQSNKFYSSRSLIDIFSDIPTHISDKARYWARSPSEAQDLPQRSIRM